MICARITFMGLCYEALNFYKEVFEAEISSIQTFKQKKDMFPTELDEKYENLVFRAELKITQDGNTSMIIMGDSPTLCFTGMNEKCGCNDNIAFDIVGEDSANISGMYNQLLKDGGRTNIPLREEVGYKIFGSLIDRYGVCWNLYCEC